VERLVAHGIEEESPVGRGAVAGVLGGCEQGHEDGRRGPERSTRHRVGDERASPQEPGGRERHERREEPRPPRHEAEPVGEGGESRAEREDERAVDGDPRPGLEAETRPDEREEHEDEAGRHLLHEQLARASPV
jgi:hypothetical protein